MEIKSIMYEIKSIQNKNKTQTKWNNIYIQNKIKFTLNETKSILKSIQYSYQIYTIFIPNLYNIHTKSI